MFRRSFSYAAAFVLVLPTALAQAQTPPVVVPAPLPADTAHPVPANLNPPPAAPGASGPDAPVSKVTESLEAKLASMKTGNGLTADEAARRSVINNVDITGKEKSIAVADAEVDATTAQFLPKLTLIASYTRLNKFHQGSVAFGAPGGALTNIDDLFPVIPNNYNLEASLNIPISDYVLRLSNAMAGANHGKASAKFDKEATRLSVARDARVYYYQWIRAQGASYVAQQALEAARGHAMDAKNAFDAGLVSRADVLRTVSQEKSAELTVAHWINNVAIATENLRIIMGDGSDVNYDIGENILTDLTPYDVPTNPNTAYAEALEHRLEIKQLGESEAALREQAAAARADRYPRLDAHADANYADPNPRYAIPAAKWHPTWNVGVTLSWVPTNIFGANAQSKIAESQADEVASKRGALKNGLRLETTQAINALAEADYGLEENYRVRRELYRAGKATIVEVTDAETDLTRARLDVVNSHVDERIARVALTHALGRDVTAQK
jgi:outer membrane protein